MELKLNKGPQDLEARVLKQGFCCGCGACLGLCPYFLVMREHVVLMEPCGLAEGRCYEVCPRTAVDLDELNRTALGRPRDDFVLGSNRGVFMARSADPAIAGRGQYGGTVSALLVHGLETGALDGALLAGNSKRYGLLPEPTLARDREAVLECAGSKYTACPTLKILDRSLRECRKLAVVARPCQTIALRKRMALEPELQDKIALIIGLFCMWALDYQRLSAHLSSSLDLKKARKVDIPYNRFVVTMEGEKPHDLDFEPLRDLRLRTCDLCFDFTAELADLSVGSTEWKDDWNTLIPRSERGEAAVRAARQAGRLKLEPLPGDRVKLLRQAALGKKQRALEALGDGCPIGDYLLLSDRERQATLSGSGEARGPGA